MSPRSPTTCRRPRESGGPEQLHETSTIGHGPYSPGSLGTAAGCTIGIAINSSSLVIHTGSSPGTFTGLLTNTSGHRGVLAYEGNEDVLIGVYNTGTGTLGASP
jgi:hypothetical protein